MWLLASKDSASCSEWAGAGYSLGRAVTARAVVFVFGLPVYAQALGTFSSGIQRPYAGGCSVPRSLEWEIKTG